MSSYNYEAYVAEFIGTFFLVLTVGLNAHQHTVLAPISIGSILMVLVFSTGSVSGAHFNPAVSLGVLLSQRDKISGNDAFIYLIVQCLGAILGGCTYWWILGETFTLGPLAPYTAWDAFVVEVLFSSALVFVVLNVATTEQDADNHYYGLAIGFTLMSAAFACGAISGCVLNPALTIAAMLTHFFHTKHPDSFSYLALYLFGPLVGALIANGLFRLIRPLEYRRSRDKLISGDGGMA